MVIIAQKNVHVKMVLNVQMSMVRANVETDGKDRVVHKESAMHGHTEINARNANAIAKIPKCTLQNLANK